MGRTPTHAKEQQTFRLSKPLVEVLDARCRAEGMEKGEVVEALLRSALDMPPLPEQEELVSLLEKCKRDHFGSSARLCKALSILLGEEISVTRLRGWLHQRSVPDYVAPYLWRLAEVANIVHKT
jgi:hypothetical protein